MPTKTSACASAYFASAIQFLASGNRLEVFLVPLTGSVYKPGAVQSVLPLVDTLTPFSAFEIFSMYELLSPERKEHIITL